jgi:glutamyl-tRNA synthetase
MDHIELAELMFPEITETPESYEDKYPPRNLADGVLVTRLGPSPTGFIHLGNLYVAMVNERLAHQSGGIFFLRVEDTDDKREVEGAAEAVINGLSYYGVNFDEGIGTGGATERANAGGGGAGYDSAIKRPGTEPGGTAARTDAGTGGAYAPYRQSERGPIYRCYVKRLVAEGKAYPCFMSGGEIDNMRKSQERLNVTPGVYGEWAKCRNFTNDEAALRIRGENPYVVRFRAADSPADISVTDGIRGELSMPGNNMDTIILKTNGIPTYHFAHVVDDHLMRTTHVIRGEEWLSSLPIHIDLFEALGWKPPEYCHTTVLMKNDCDIKRKLSKRKDPESSLDYYRREGYHPEAVREYLFTVINSNYEEWRLENPDSPYTDFTFTTEKMSRSGTLFDMDKLRDVSKEVLLRIPAEKLAEFLIDWAKYAEKGNTKSPGDAKSPEGVGPTVLPPQGLSTQSDAELLSRDKKYLEKIIDIGRNGEKPRKDLAYGAQILDFIGYFFDEKFKISEPWPENVPSDDIPALLNGYLATYKHADDQSEWFGKIRALAEANGYAAKPKDFKKEPDRYKGHVGDVSTVVRLAIMGRRNSPDLWEIQQILGEERVRRRVADAVFTRK